MSEVLSWGWNGKGQCGVGRKSDCTVPEVRVSLLACPLPSHVTLGGAVQRITEIGDGDVAEAVAGVACSSFHSLAVTADGDVYGWGQTKVRRARCVVAISLLTPHAQHGQLGLGLASSLAPAADVVTPRKVAALSRIRVQQVRAWSWVVPYRRNRALMCNLGRV